ncbi:MAG: trehalose-phosphatase [Kofleriaceae bacterium]|nr:trehalose-phosphatase [Kofleriaceae bacterium]
MRNPLPAPFDPAFWLSHARRDDLVLLLDFDGTLVPFAETAEEANLDAEGSRLLDELAETGVQVVIVTGRPLALAERIRPAAQRAWFVAEHGLWRHDGRADWHGPVGGAPAIAALAASLVHSLEVPGTRIERKSHGLCVHWRSVSPAQRDSVIAAAERLADEWLDANPEFERIDGVEMLEVRHRSATKASAVTWMRERLPGAHLLAIGDDDTDEDMFAALAEPELAIVVRNGRCRRTRARASLPDPTAVRDLLGWIIATRRRRDVLPPPLEIMTTPISAARSQLVVVSNRVPPQAPEGRRQQVSGLVSALAPALAEQDSVWLGWSGRDHDAGPALVVEEGARPSRASFDFRPSWRTDFYDGFCNRALWPLLHGFCGRARYRDTDWRAYVDVNATYARFAAALAEPTGDIWVHDYHLLLVGQQLARHGFRGRTGLFLHVPFPQPDVFETMPWCDEILAAMREFTFLGLHTDQWAANLRACLQAQERRLGRALPMPVIDTLPIGVDSTTFAPTPDEELDREVAGLRLTLGDRRLILGVDRLDYAKGIPERLVAFDRLLEMHPEWRTKVSFIQVSVPSRVDVPEYAELRQQVEELVGRINGRYGEADWVPVRYLYRSYDHQVLAQLYRTADVALVTPLRDGMNLVAKEFIAAQDPEHPAVLVLSKFAGAAAQLADAILTNPYHADGLAEDLHRALTMSPDERRLRHSRLRTVVEADTPQQWATTFLAKLRVATSSRLQS